MSQNIRVVCPRCRRPGRACLCAELPKIHNRTRISIIQHPKERRHHLGTVRLLEAALARCEVLVHHRRFESTVEIAECSQRAGVLFPTDAARRLDEVPTRELPDQLIVIDGTWAMAAGLHRDNEWLQALPHYTLPPGPEGRYRIRKEPDPRFISTLEAVVRALRLLEPQTPGLAELEAAFDEMVDRQLQYRGHPRAKKRGPRPPMPIGDRWEQLVLVHGEHSGGPDGELIALGLYRVSRANAIDFVLRPLCTTPSPQRLAHIGLSAEALEQGTSRVDLERALDGWLGETDCLLCWTEATARLIREQMPGGREVHSLKTEYARRHRGGTGGLDAVLSSEGLEAMAPPLGGRIGVELGRLAALVGRLRSC